MKVHKTKLSDVLIIEEKIYFDNRGFFKESWNQKEFDNKLGLKIQFVQDNHSKSNKSVLRGLHYQLNKPQGKLVRVTKGKVLDVVVDLRKKSKTYGKHLTIELSEDNSKQLWVPKGFAHGYLVLSNSADFLYKTTDYYDPTDEHCILWNDNDLNINWGLLKSKPKVSKKDLSGKNFKDAKKYDF